MADLAERYERLRAAAAEAAERLDEAAAIIKREFGERDPLEPWAEAEQAAAELRQALA